MIFPDTGRPVLATFRGSVASSVYPSMDHLLHLHLHKYHEGAWRDMLLALSCRRTFWLRRSDQEVFRYEPEVIDLTQHDDDDDDDDNGFHRSTPDIAEAKQ